MQKQTPSVIKLLGMAVFALSCFGILTFLWISFGGAVPFKSKQYEVRVSFPEATTLAEQADVRIAGVPVGKVLKKDLDRINNRTRAVLSIKSQYAPIPKDTRAILRQKTLLGETFVELTPGHRQAGMLKDHDILANSQVAPTVELDEILRIFDPQTKAAFRDWVQSSALQMKGTAPSDLNDALGNLAGFAQDGGNVLRVLDDQHTALRQLVKNTGVVFGALNQRRGQLRQLIVNSQRTFSATASQDDALADTFRVFPTFLDESRATAARLETFSRNTRPLVNALKPAADNLGPTVRDLGGLAPDLTNLFVHLKPVIRAAPSTLPQAARFLRGARPVLKSLHPFLQSLNPFLSYLNYDQQVVSHFVTNASAALNHRINGVANTHELPQFGVIDSHSLSIQSNSVPAWARGNAYIAPNGYDRGIPLGVIQESFSCANVPGGIQRNPVDSHDGSDELPPCFQAPGQLYDGGQFPTVDRGEVKRAQPPTFSLRGRTPANPNTHR